MSEAKLFGVLALHPSQKPLIDAHCFGDCGRIIVGAIDVGDLGFVYPCRTDPCPYVERQTEEPIGTTGDGEPLYLRKLKATS